jgi:diguanylate cyclase (GGDEF)-like protein
MEPRGIASPRWAATAVAAPLAVAAAAMASPFAGLDRTIAWDVAWTAAALSALAGLLLARRQAPETTRRRWTLWAIAGGCWVGGQVVWDLFGVLGFPASPTLADFLWWAFALIVILSMTRASQGPALVRVAGGMESLALIAAAMALCSAALWPEVARSTLPLAPKVSALLYPAVYVSATVLVVQAMVGGSQRAIRSLPLGLVLGGIAAQALAFILWSYQLLERSYAPGHSWIDPLWVVGLGAIGVGGLLAARRPEGVPLLDEPAERSGVLPAALLIVLLAGLAVARVGGATPGTTISLEIGLMCCGGALLARSGLLARRMSGLLDLERRALVRVAEREVALARSNARLVEESRRDPLTGISNRRALSDDLPVLEGMRREQGSPSLAVALCDVDHFKAYNDLLGHLAGDQALRAIATTVRGALRSGDAAYRFGGEELLLVLRDTTVEEALSIGERIRAAVERAALPHPGAPRGILTVSIGIAAGPGEAAELLALADTAVYEAKRQGRNQVLAADEKATVSAVGPRVRAAEVQEPVPRHLRGMLAISRAAAAGAGDRAVLEALTEVIQTELAFQVVAINLLEPDRQALRAVLVSGDLEAREALLDTVSARAEWDALLRTGAEICGAIWLEAGTYEDDPSAPAWTPRAVPGLAADSWHPDDMLLLPLRGTSGDLLGVVSVDQPLLGRRPAAAELRVLMAVADHAALSLEQARRSRGSRHAASRELRLAALMLLAETLDLRDPSTARHARAVGEYARQIALAMGLGPDSADRLHAAGVLHDLGKLGIPDAILHKPGRLGAGEWEEIRRHPEMGAQILEHAGLRDLASWVRAHHERLDGRGYPRQLNSVEIPLEARILAVADAYEAMTTERPYRSAMTAEEAREELRQSAGSQFDAEAVEALLRSLDGASEPADPQMAAEALA